MVSALDPSGLFIVQAKPEAFRNNWMISWVINTVLINLLLYVAARRNRYVCSEKTENLNKIF